MNTKDSSLGLFFFNIYGITRDQYLHTHFTRLLKLKKTELLEPQTEKDQINEMAGALCSPLLKKP
jgi:hypothetical protein